MLNCASLSVALTAPLLAEREVFSTNTGISLMKFNHKFPSKTFQYEQPRSSKPLQHTSNNVLPDGSLKMKQCLVLFLQ